MFTQDRPAPQQRNFYIIEGIGLVVGFGDVVLGFTVDEEFID